MSHFDETRGLSVGALAEGQEDDGTSVIESTSVTENQVTESFHRPKQIPSESGVSLHSNLSKGEPPIFAGELPQSASFHRPKQIPSESGVSLHSNQSKGEPPIFAGELPQSTSVYTDGPGGVLCSICPKRAFKSCLTCMASYCELHVRQHYTTPALQRHRLVEVIEDLEERLCQQHYRELEFFCKTDQTLVCALCTIKQHRQHDIAELAEHNKESELNLTTQLKKSELTSQKNLPAPKSVEFTSVKTDAVSLSWGAPEGLTGPIQFMVTWKNKVDHGNLVVSGTQVEIQDLNLGEEYTFTVATLYDGSQSPCVSATVRTDIPAPDIRVNADLTTASVSWSKPDGVDVASYLLTLSSGGECIKTVNIKSIHYCFADLEMGTEYTINASTVQKKGGQSRPISKVIRTGKGEFASTQGCYRSPFQMGVFCKEEMTAECEPVKKGPPDCYLLPTQKSNINENEFVRRWTFGEIDQTKPIKNILLVGETGTGKTTLINTMVNYMLGVQWEHGIWYKITQEHEESQAKSHTTAITVYEVFVKTCSLALRIIDTPGYGCTDGIELDQKVAENLHMLFRSKDGIHEISAVGLVLKSGMNRLTDFQRYIFGAILSLFGKNVEKNIVLMITHSDGMSVENVISALNEDNIPYAKDVYGTPLYFMFNNRQSRGCEKENENIFRMAWDLGNISMEKFVSFLQDIDVIGLGMTEGVLRERKRLGACVYNLEDAIEMEELKQIQLQQTQEALEENKEKCGNNEDFTYEVDEPYKDREPVPWYSFSTKATCCTKCEENCHYPFCWWVKDLYKCSVMKDGKCTVCKNKCPVSDHVRHKTIYVPKTKRVKKTYEDLKKQHKEQVDIKKALEDEINKSECKKKELLEEAYQCIIKLEEIALKKDSVSTLMHLDFLIEKMVETGDDTKVQKLVNLNKQLHSSDKTTFVRWVTRLQNAWKDRPKQQGAKNAKDSQPTK